MAQSRQTKEYRTFVKGIITEASPLAFPEDSSIDEENFVLHRNGSRTRRYGIDYINENINFGAFTLGEEDFNAFSFHKWEHPDNMGVKIFAVAQVGDELRVHDISSEDTPYTVLATFDLQTFKAESASAEQVRLDKLSSTVGNNVIVFASKSIDPFYIKYDNNTGGFTATSIDLQIRDFYGVDDGFATNYEPIKAIDLGTATVVYTGTSLQTSSDPSTVSIDGLTDEHKYNLFNQGWDLKHITDYSETSRTIAGETGVKRYPSNAAILYDAYVGGAIGTTDDTKSRWVYRNLIDKTRSYGTTPAPKGRYILDAFQRSASREAQSGITGLDTDYEYNRPELVAYFGGRIFYTGLKSYSVSTSLVPLNGWIFYSKVIDDLRYIGQCYQDADPTAQHINEPVATDGGVIVLSEAQAIMGVAVLNTSLMVFASNGVWEIKAAEFGFTPNDYKINKITNIGCINGDSVVVAEDMVFYWSESGIYVLARNQMDGEYKAQNITENTIQTLYNDIPMPCKLQAKGIFEHVTKVVKWLYTLRTDVTSTDNRFWYDRQLNFDLVLKAFYKFSFGEIGDDPIFITGMITSPYFNTIEGENDVIDSTGVSVVDADGENVVATYPMLVDTTSQINYMFFIPETGTYSFASLKNTDFLDWTVVDAIGVDAYAYLWTGHEGFGDTQRKKQVVYLTTHMENTEVDLEYVGGDLVPVNPSGCKVQARWDHMDTAESNKWVPTNGFQIFRKRRPIVVVGTQAKDGQAVVTCKSKLRGSGKALSLYFETEAGKDCRIYGWAVDAVGYSVV